MVKLAHYKSILREAGEQFHVLPLQGDARALITRRGGRVLGLFPTSDADNLLWTNSAAFESVNHFHQFVDEGQWNLGGERIWIAPEIQYNCRDRSDFWGTLSVPPQMDPGEYRMTVDSRVTLTMREMRLEAYNLASGTQKLAVHRTIAPAENLLTIPRDVFYFGYKQRVGLNGKDTTAYSEAWNLVQLNAGGQLIIPCAPLVEDSVYFGSVPQEAREVCQSDVPYLRLNITGKRQYKIGYKSVSTTGRLGYYNTLLDGQAYLLVRSFFNNPSNVYAEEPPDQPGVNGHSVHVYNDGGEFGGENAFGEMEVSGTTIHGRDAHDSITSDEFVMWVYIGAPASVKYLAHLLLGVKL